MSLGSLSSQLSPSPLPTISVQLGCHSCLSPHMKSGIVGGPPSHQWGDSPPYPSPTPRAVFTRPNSRDRHLEQGVDLGTVDKPLLKEN